MKPDHSPRQTLNVRTVLHLSVITAFMALTNQAQAIPLGAFWVENFVTDNVVDASDLTGFRSFDLYVQLEAGDVVTAADFGIAGPNSGLNTTQSIFEHGFGGNLAPNPAFIGAFPDLAFDTFLRLGDLDGAASQISVQSYDFSNPAALTAVWNANAPGGFTEANPDGSNALILASITVSSAGGFGAHTAVTEFLGGQLFLSGEGPNGTFGREIAANGVVSIPNAFNTGLPAPGPLAILAIAGTFTARRRRPYT